MFASIERIGRLNNSVMVLGYVIMRVALVFQWLRAAKDDPARRRVCLTYAATISIAQVGWVVQIVVPLAAPSAPFPVRQRRRRAARTRSVLRPDIDVGVETFDGARKWIG
jgi:hypothetical protein